MPLVFKQIYQNLIIIFGIYDFATQFTRKIIRPQISRRKFIFFNKKIKHIISLKFMWFKYELLTPSDKKDTAFGSCGRISLQGVGSENRSESKIKKKSESRGGRDLEQ